jgi:protein-S-isoprenylcysteine O-methyltransferase Ste14
MTSSTHTTPAHAGVRFPPPFLFAGGFVAGWLLHRAWPLHVFGASLAGIRPWLGWLLLAAGLVLMLSGLVTFLRAHTAVIPHHPATRLVTTGPYRFTRNPMYLGLTLVYLGGVALVDSFWPLLILPVVLLVLTAAVIRREERYLAAAFGDAYNAYCRRVRRWL